jgi:hypothetical protein
MNLANAFIRLAKTQRRIANEYAADLRAGHYPLVADKHRIEVERLRNAARTHLQWARRERQWTRRMGDVK